VSHTTAMTSQYRNVSVQKLQYDLTAVAATGQKVRLREAGHVNKA